jgi:RNA polymerase sigma-70 factor (ECF subfamily)
MRNVRNGPGDSDVIREVLGGNVNAFEQLVARYQDTVCAIVTKKVPREDIEEVAHEVFVRAYRSLGTFRAKTPFKNWLAGIAVRCCCDFWRQRYRNRETPADPLAEDGKEWVRGLLVDGFAQSSGDAARSGQALRVLRRAMERLSAEDRMVVTLIHLEEYTTSEAAELLRWSVAKVKIRAYRARKKLRKALSEVVPDRQGA